MFILYEYECHLQKMYWVWEKFKYPNAKVYTHHMFVLVLTILDKRFSRTGPGIMGRGNVFLLADA